MSPGYPGYYSNNLNCVWTLQIPVDGYLRLEFVAFHTEQWYGYFVTRIINLQFVKVLCFTLHYLSYCSS